MALQVRHQNFSLQFITITEIQTHLSTLPLIGCNAFSQTHACVHINQEVKSQASKSPATTTYCNAIDRRIYGPACKLKGN